MLAIALVYLANAKLAQLSPDSQRAPRSDGVVMKHFHVWDWTSENALSHQAML